MTGTLPAAQNIHTGLVLDGRGLEGRPSMSPRILDENGREVYGTAYVSREFAVQRGVAGFSRDLGAAQTSRRVAPQPLTVKGLRVEGIGASNFIISNADAAEIRGASDNLLFMKECRVVIVLD